MKKFIRSLLFFTLISISSIVNANAKSYVPQVGEILQYKMFVMGMYVGDTTITIKKTIKFEGKKCFYIISETKSTPEIAKKFYPLHDVHIIYLDVKTLLPVKCLKKLNEGTYKNNVSISFYRDKKEYFFKDRDDKKGRIVSYTYPAMDLLGLIFYVRGLDLDKDKKVKLGLVAHDRPINFIGKITSEKKMRQHTILTFSELQGKQFMMTYTKDKRIPLKLSMVGLKIHNYNINVTGKLVKYQKGN